MTLMDSANLENLANKMCLIIIHLFCKTKNSMKLLIICSFYLISFLAVEECREMLNNFRVPLCNNVVAIEMLKHLQLHHVFDAEKAKQIRRAGKSTIDKMDSINLCSSSQLRGTENAAKSHKNE